MSRFFTILCDNMLRRNEISSHDSLNGIDYIEVVTEPPEDNQLILEVHFIEKSLGMEHVLDDMLNDLDGQESRFTIEGGVRVRNIQVTDAIVIDSHLRLRVDRRGDFSTYTLKIEDDRLDPPFAQCEFSFKAGCPSDFDCRQLEVCEAEPSEEPDIDYMAKDYASFRQALLDFAAVRIPGWEERHEADQGIMLLELLAYVGDHLSYYQDSVANEAFLESARQRISVRRHGRLIDYHMHDGRSAAAFIHVDLNTGSSGTLPQGTQVLTRINSPLLGEMPPHKDPVFGLGADESALVVIKEEAIAAADAVFETVHETKLDDRLNEIQIYTWGNSECCLPRGATSVYLEDDLTACLAPGDFLLFEEVTSPITGAEADADPAHRQIVRLAAVEYTQDSLLGNKDLTRVAWDVADALTFPLCLWVVPGDGDKHVSVARGNLVLVDHGCTVGPEQYDGPTAPPHENLRRAYRFRLKEGPLSFRMKLTEDPVPVRELMGVDSGRNGKTEAQVSHLDVMPSDNDTGNGGWKDWRPVADLLDSDAFDYHFVPEVDNDGRAVLRFGDGEFGMSPPDGTKIKVTYRVGVGSSGNVGAESLTHIIWQRNATNWPDIKSVTNPLPAWGGLDPERMEQVKRLAPAAFHAEQFRAVTEEDYADAAEKHSEVSNAVATFRWTGSWHTVFITVDPKNRTDLPPELEQRIKDWVRCYTQTGYDLEIDPPTYVPLDIEIDVCVSPEHFRAHVYEALLETLSNRTLSDGQVGFFHPDNFTFGEALYASRLYAAVDKVEGVDSAIIRKFQRFSRAASNELEQGYIPMGRLEVARLDCDPNFPENGILKLNMLGGK